MQNDFCKLYHRTQICLLLDVDISCVPVPVAVAVVTFLFFAVFCTDDGEPLFADAADVLFVGVVLYLTHAVAFVVIGGDSAVVVHKEKVIAPSHKFAFGTDGA